MKTLWQYVFPHRWNILFGTFVKFFASLMELVIPYLLARMLDRVVPTGNRQMIYLYGLAMLFCAGLAMASNIYANRIAARNSGYITRKLRHDLFQKVNSLSMAQMDSISVSSAISRLTTDTYNINNFLTRTQRMGVRAPILLLGGLMMTLLLDARLTLALVAVLPLISMIIFVVTRKSMPLFAKQQTALDRMVRVMQENISGVRIIKALSKTRYEQQRFDESNKHLADTANHASRTAAVSSPLISLTLNLGLTLVVLAGGFLVNAGLSTPGTIIAFLNYFLIILQATMGITRIFIMTSRGAASANRVEEVLKMPEDLAALPRDLLPEDPQFADCHVVFDGVSFSYNKVRNNLENISFCLKQGQTLGILGATGSGKTTLINLMLRLYDPDQGRILLYEKDIRTLDPRKMREHTGVVFQNDFLMADTVAQNIRYYREIPPEDLEQAARAAQAMQFIRDTKHGMEHLVAQRGNNLSGGQKQRLLISRALAGKPRLLILDDASSALDYRTDAALRRALRTDYSRITSVIIAQRVSSIRHADQILMLDEGRAIGQGTHEELMECCPEYRDIALTQMGAEGGLAYV